MKNVKKHLQDSENRKQQDLEFNKSDATNQLMTTNQGLKINDDNNSLKAGESGLRYWKILF